MNDNNSGERALEIGERIIQARKETGGMRQEELADLLGVSVRSMQAYESGEVVPYRKLRDLERVLGRPMAWFLHGDEAVEARDSQLEEILRELKQIAETSERLVRTNGEILELLMQERGA